MSDITTTIEEQAEACGTEKIYCANCIHCKLVTAEGENHDEFYLRVRCDAGKWKKKLGEEKIHKYFTVARRSIDYCDMYEDMGDAEDFIKELRMTLPTKDESYEKKEII
ncbi:MAG: hypothetical protein K6G52_00325 [Treponemataceae bacterium]|nr:hypothetical protein [Treponemataceae bacterium]